jgi:organic hydroperoxide reductase OsmC/OhrA
MDKINPLFTATATAIGGRNGHTETADGAVKADLSLPKVLGGQGKTGFATPEHLFAAGYAALGEHSISLQNKRSVTPQKPRLPVPSRSVSARAVVLA